MKANTKKRFREVEMMLRKGESATSATITHGIDSVPEGLMIGGFEGGVLLRSQPDPKTGDFSYVLLYCVSYSAGPRKKREAVMGMAGFRQGEGIWYNFDRLGVEDSWYPVTLSGSTRKLLGAKAMVEEMRRVLANAQQRYAAHVSRQALGLKVNFGPTTRTLLPAEIERYKEMVKRGSFSLTPSGFGTGYRFFQSTKPAPRYSGRKPASDEARKLLEAPYLVYEEIDCD